MFISVVMLTSCQPKPGNDSFDEAAAREEINKTIDKMYLAYNTKDITILTPLLAAKGLFIGTDPDEVWDKDSYVGILTRLFADTAYKPEIKAEKREILFDEHGNTAIVTDQFNSFMIKNIPLRQVCRMVKSEDKWLCDFSAIALIPENEDVQKLSDALN